MLCWPLQQIILGGLLSCTTEVEEPLLQGCAGHPEDVVPLGNFLQAQFGWWHTVTFFPGFVGWVWFFPHFLIGKNASSNGSLHKQVFISYKLLGGFIHLVIVRTRIKDMFLVAVHCASSDSWVWMIAELWLWTLTTERFTGHSTNWQVVVDMEVYNQFQTGTTQGCHARLVVPWLFEVGSKPVKITPENHLLLQAQFVVSLYISCCYL